MKYLSILVNAGATQQQKDSVALSLGIPHEKVTELANQADPTKEKKFETWILRQMGGKLIRLPEDTNRVMNVLKNFVVYNNKKKLKNRDINQYKQIHDLETELQNLRVDQYVPSEQLTVDALKSFPGVILSDDEPNGKYVVAAISNVKSLQKLGLGTKWCTREDYKGSMAQYYIESSITGNVFQVYEVSEDNLKVKYQFEDNFDQFMDVDDRNVVSVLYNDDELLQEVELIFSKLHEQAPMVGLALNTGVRDAMPNLHRVNKDAVEKILVKYLRNNDPSDMCWDIANELQITHGAFETSVSDFIDSTLYYFLDVAKERGAYLEDVLFDKNSYVEWSDLTFHNIYQYFITLVYPEINAKFDEVEDEQYLDNKEDLKAELKKWENLLVSIPETHSESFYTNDEKFARDLLSYARDYKQEDFYPARKIIKQFPDVWAEYKKWLQSIGYMPDLVEHDWGE